MIEFFFASAILFVFIGLVCGIFRANIGMNRLDRGINDVPPDSILQWLLLCIATWYLPSFWRTRND